MFSCSTITPTPGYLEKGTYVNTHNGYVCYELLHWKSKTEINQELTDWNKEEEIW